jgi:hypothetical protein
MTRLLRLTLLLLPAVTVGFAAGLYAQRRYQIAQIHAAGDFAREMAGLKDAIPAPPPKDDWLYPGAKVRGRIEGMALRISGELVRPAGTFLVFTTKDSFDDVARFYAGKAGFEDPDAVAASRKAFSHSGSLQGVATLVLDDAEMPDEPGGPRPVRSKTLIRRSPSYDVTVVLTQADGEEHLHGTLLFEPRVEETGQPAIR